MALNFDPLTMAVVGIDAHLPPIPPERLTAQALRERFISPPVWSPELQGERRINARDPTHASVLVPLVDRGELMVLLTQRTAHLYDHPGQISFPGGRAEAADRDAVDTALREAQEEIGLAPDFVHVLGALPLYTTGTGFIVTPVIALVDPGFTVVADSFEVAEVFEVPLRFLMTPGNHRWHEVDWAGARREYLSMPWPHPSAEREPYFIWGATAAMLRNLYRLLAA